MSSQKLIQKIGNVFIKMLLRGPFHAMLSGNMMLVTVKGKKTGKPHTTPVNYVLNNDEILVISQSDRTWWRNLRGGGEASLLLRGKAVMVKGEVVEDRGGVAAKLASYLEKVPKVVPYFDVSIDQEGQFNQDDLNKAAVGRLFIIFKSEGENP